MNNNCFKIKGRTLAFYLAPAVLVYVFVVILPLILSLRYSFFNWSGSKNMKYIGFQNYIDLINDKSFWLSFKNNIIIIILSFVGQIGTAFILTVIMISRMLKFKEFHRTVIFVPVVVSAVVIGFIWNIIYSKDYGLLNLILRSLNLDFLIIPWLDDPKYVIFSVTLPIVWQYIGFYLIIFLAAVQNIPKDVLEVAEIDGAVGFKKTIHIILPMMYNTLKVAIMLCISGNMKVFDSIFIMTGGGPGTTSTVMAQYAYNNSFTMYKMGYGSTIAMSILILSMTLILISRKLMGGKRYD